MPGRPEMFATTREFLDYFNLKSLEQLPALMDVRDLDTMTSALPLEEFHDPQVTESTENLLDDQTQDSEIGAEIDGAIDTDSADTEMDSSHE